MLKKIFTILAMLVIAAQFSVARANIPANVEIKSVEENSEQVTIKISRRIDLLESYSCKVYRTNDGKQFFKCESNFEGTASLFGFSYKDLAKDTPYNLTLEFEFNFSDDGYKFSRPLVKSAKYEIEFARYKNELRAQIFFVE